MMRLLTLLWFSPPQIISDGIDPPPFLSALQPEIILSRGYPIEVHHVVTKDLYVIELHRIPSGKRGGASNSSAEERRGRPVFLQHGMMATDHIWLSGPANMSLGSHFCCTIRLPEIFVFYYCCKPTSWLTEDMTSGLEILGATLIRGSTPHWIRKRTSIGTTRNNNRHKLSLKIVYFNSVKCIGGTR